MGKKKRMVYFLACALLFACGEKKEQQGSSSEAIAVVTEKAEMSSNYGMTPYVGTVQASSTTMVSFNGTGILKEVKVSEGQFVKKGQLLATVDDSQAQNALKAAKAMLEQALDAEKRMKQLHDSGSLPDMKWIEVESKVQQAEASYEMCRKTVDDCKIYATSSGVVSNKIMSVGENVLPSEPILSILNINDVKVQVSIPEKEIAAIGSDTPSTICVEALGGETFQGGRIEKGVSADALTHTYNIYINLPNPEQKLLPGMVTSVLLSKKAAEPALTVPVKAVQQAADKSLFVWIKESNKAKRITVELGETVGNRVIINGGQLTVGQQIVVEGYQKLTEGAEVK